MGLSNIVGGRCTTAGSSQTKAKPELAQTSLQAVEEQSQEQQTRHTGKEVNEALQMSSVINKYCCIIEEEQPELQVGETETFPLASGDMDEYRCFIVEEYPQLLPHP